ncbi:MAG: hypothetical protein Q8M15_00050 [Bacteroidota bacterium]|nr:hypothetical protein [Bacteroidota bacterium]
MKLIKVIFNLLFFSVLFCACSKCPDDPYLYIDQTYKDFIPYKGKEQLKFLNTDNNDTFIISVQEYQTKYDKIYDWAAEGRCASAHNCEKCSLDMQSKYGNFSTVLWYNSPNGIGSLIPSTISYHFFVKDRSTSNLNSDMKLTTVGGVKKAELITTCIDTMTIGIKVYHDVYMLSDYWFYDRVYLNKEYGILRINNLIKID